MKKILKFDSLIIIDERNQKYSSFKFEDGLNVIHGKNTSGKSTLIQSLLYSIGINDVSNNLSDILNNKLIFRLDITINGSKYIFIRDENNFYVKYDKIYL
jgi:DNA repair exonuclease SbcCD ATPase subunit